MLKFGLSAALFFTAAAVQARPATTTTTTQPAQPQQEVTPPPAFIEAATAFGQCVRGAATAAPATVTPEAAAAQALASCATQKAAMETQFEAWVASDAFPAEGRDMARQQFRAQMTQGEAGLAAEIGRRRAAPATPATPSN